MSNPRRDTTDGGAARPEGIALASFAISVVLCLASVIQYSTRVRWSADATLIPLVAIILVTCGVQLFVTSMRVFVPVTFVQLLALISAIISTQGELPLIEIMLMTVLVLSVALRLPARYWMPLCLIVRGAIFAVWYSQGMALIDAAIPLVVELVVMILVWRVVRYREDVVVARDLLAEEQQSVMNLTAANDSLLQHLPEMREESAENERLRITRELHDTLGYSMTNIVMIMNAAQYLIDNTPDKVRDYCARTKALASETMEETRSTLYKLRAIGRQTPENPVIFFHRLCRDFQEATQVTTEFHAGNLVRRLPKRVFDPMVRAVQVGFINALKHSKTTRIRLFIWIGDDSLTMTIWNSVEQPHRVGLRAVDEGIGLSGIRERLEELEGSVKTGYQNNGFSLVVSIPSKELVDADYSPPPGL